MNTISLFKPVVLRSSLKDMTKDQYETATQLLISGMFLVPGKDGIKFVDISKLKDKSEFPKFYLFGSEAVCYYRQSLGLPDVSITDIDVDDIITEAEDFDTLFDIVFLLNSVFMKNERNKKLRDLGCPMIIQHNEYRKLQEAVEHLQDNCYNGNPITISYDDSGFDEEPQIKEEPRKSLKDIGYSLLAYKKENEPIPADN